MQLGSRQIMPAFFVLRRIMFLVNSECKRSELNSIVLIGRNVSFYRQKAQLTVISTFFTVSIVCTINFTSPYFLTIIHDRLLQE